jgi:hypothetical protein
MALNTEGTEGTDSSHGDTEGTERFLQCLSVRVVEEIAYTR